MPRICQPKIWQLKSTHFEYDEMEKGVLKHHGWAAVFPTASRWQQRTPNQLLAAAAWWSEILHPRSGGLSKAKRTGWRRKGPPGGGKRRARKGPAFELHSRITFKDIHERVFEAVLAGGFDGGLEAFGLVVVLLCFHLDGHDHLFLGRLLLDTFSAG